MIKFTLAAALVAIHVAPARADEATAVSMREPAYPAIVARPPFSMYLGVEVGSLMPVGLTSLWTVSKHDRLRWGFELAWEPSYYLQSYSLGTSYHFWDNLFFVSARLRYVQLHAPFSRGFRARTDHQLGIGPELGLRWLIDESKRFLLTTSIGVCFFPSEVLALPPLFTLNLGFAIGLAR